MNRKDFLAKLGLGAAFVLTSTCIGGCSKDGDATPQSDVDFTIDTSQFTELQTNGGYIIHENNFVIAKTVAGEFVASSIVCSHENLKKMIYKSNTNEFFCTEHSARFSLDGTGLNEKGSRGLVVYQTSLDNNTLRVFS